MYENRHRVTVFTRENTTTAQWVQKVAMHGSSASLTQNWSIGNQCHVSTGNDRVALSLLVSKFSTAVLRTKVCWLYWLRAHILILQV